MGAAIRAFAWHETPLGPAANWSLSLRSIVQMLVAQGHAISLFWGPDLTMIYNDSYGAFLGGKEPTALGGAFSTVWSDIWEDVKPFADDALAGKTIYMENLRLMMHRNGSEEETFWTFSYSPLYNDNGEIAGLINVAVDTTPVVHSRRAQDVMQRELMHRVKNSLAVTSAIVNQSMRSATTLEDARVAVTSRIQALGDAQSLLATSATDTDVGAVVIEALRPHVDHEGRTDVSGPTVKLSSQQAIGLSMAVYELATNALKYGALSNDAGTVAIRWFADADGAFRFTWTERGGPAVQAPSRSGFGSRLTNRIVGSYFSGTGTTTYRAEGVHYDLAGRLEA